MTNDNVSTNYQKIKHTVFFTNLFLDIILLFVFFLTGMSSALKQILNTTFTNTYLLNGAFVVILAIASYVIHFPTGYFLGHYWEHRFGLSNQKFSLWLKDDLIKATLGLFIAVIFVEVIYMFLARYQQNWWIGVGLFWLVVSFVLARLTPNVIIPLFYKYDDLDDVVLKEKILNLFKRCQVSLKNVYAINFSSKTKKANAFFCGLGNNRRVVLGDTLLSNFTHEEIEVVVAHELGHLKNRDIVRFLFVRTVVTFLGLYLVSRFLLFSMSHFSIERIDDISFLPMILVVLISFSFVTAPFLNAYSRRREVQADQFSLDVTKSPKDFISLMEKLGQMNLAEFQPFFIIEWMFYDHPPLEKRIQFAKNYRG